MRSAVFLSLFFSSFGVTPEKKKGPPLPGDAGWQIIPPFFFFFFFFEESGNKLWLGGAHPQALGTQQTTHKLNYLMRV